VSAVDVRDGYDWLNGLAVVLGPRHLRMGVRVVGDEPWLAPDHLTGRELELKEHLLAQHDGLVRIDDGFDDAVGELLQAIGVDAIGSTIQRVETACRAVVEDVLIMSRDETAWKLVGGWLVFPNQWTIAEKMGLSLAAIHDPVDGYSEMLEQRLDTFFDRLGAGRIYWRRNWFFHDDPNFYQPDKMQNRAMTTADEAAELFIRSEYQTLRRLPESDVIIFTVKTQVAPIEELRRRPIAAEQIVEFLETATDRALANKDADGRHQAIADYLTS